MSSTGAPGAKRPPGPAIGNQMIVLFAFMIALLVMFDNDIRQGLGKIVGLGLSPLVGFDGQLPILTLLFTGLLMSFFSISVRHLFVDWVSQARTARITSAFQKELREARQNNNTYKLKKLKFGPDYILPKPFDSRLAERVPQAVAKAAKKGMAAAKRR